MDFFALFAIALAGALASPLGGAISLWTRPTTLALSIAVGFAAGALLGAFAFEMLPKAAENASLPIALSGFAAGVACIAAGWRSRRDVLPALQNWCRKRRAISSSNPPPSQRLRACS